MKRVYLSLIALLTVILLTACAAGMVAYASEAEDEAVSAMIAQLEAIDTLQEMQNKRSSYTNAGEYEDYIAKMFAARLAAQSAYDALTAAQQAQIDSTLTAKLNDKLDNIVVFPTVAVTPRDDGYPYEVIFKDRIVYEIGHHVSKEMPCTIILVDTRETGSSWTPDGLYEYGQNNYEVTYCCDAVVSVSGGSHYKRMNLEDSDYYGESSAAHIRAIVQNSYPFLSLDEMKARLKSGGLDSAFVDSLTRGDIISAVQLAIWAYSNVMQEGMAEYAGTIEMTNNGILYNPIHDYTNELWSWWDTTNSFPGIYDAKAEYRVNTLVNYLCNLPGVAPTEAQLVISDVKVARAELVAGSNDIYRVGMYVYLNNGANADDDLTITIASTSASGTVTDTNTCKVDGSTKYGMYVNARYGDTISVVVEGTQHLAKGVYFYEPEGGATKSQCLVGMAEGETPIEIQENFVFATDIEKGIRIYKTEVSTGLPLSDITFTVYRAQPEAGDVLSKRPTSEEIAKYATEENKVGSVTTDATGYAFLSLADGTYLVVEEHNTDKVLTPVAPFYVTIPMPYEQTTENENGVVTEIKTLDVISVHPKNEPVVPPETPPDIPVVPDRVTGFFSIVKHDASDENKLLAGAEFQVYRPATVADNATTIITCGGIEYAVVPVAVITTGTNGVATSPELECGTYFLVETRAPAGYNQLTEAISVTVDAGDAGTTRTIKIPNKAGSILPETGGPGVVWFWTTGSMLLMTAAVLLIAPKRMIAHK